MGSNLDSCVLNSCTAASIDVRDDSMPPSNTIAPWGFAAHIQITGKTQQTGPGTPYQYWVILRNWNACFLLVCLTTSRSRAHQIKNIDDTKHTTIRKQRPGTRKTKRNYKTRAYCLLASFWENKLTRSRGCLGPCFQLLGYGITLELKMFPNDLLEGRTRWDQVTCHGKANSGFSETKTKYKTQMKRVPNSTTTEYED